MELLREVAPFAGAAHRPLSSSKHRKAPSLQPLCKETVLVLLNNEQQGAFSA